MGTGSAMPRMGGGGMQGPYMMAEGGDVMVDRPTLFVAGEAGPERATFKPMPKFGPGGMSVGDLNLQPREMPQDMMNTTMDRGPQERARQTARDTMLFHQQMGACPVGRGASEGIRANLLAKYGQAAGAMGARPQPPDARTAMMQAQSGGLQGMMRGAVPSMPMQGAGGWGGTFAQMGGQAAQQMLAQRIAQQQALAQQQGPDGQPQGPQPMQRPAVMPQWMPEPSQGWGYY
jgi:hypothetical protein